MKSGKRWRVAGFCADHMHLGDQLRKVIEHPAAELVGVFDPDLSRIADICKALGIGEDLRFDDAEPCMDVGKPDIVMICSATTGHRSWVEQMAGRDVHVMLEKPMATSLADADAMISAMSKSRGTLTVNWPLAWYPPHRTTQRLIADGAIGEVLEVHYYDGNRGPLRHGTDKQTRELVTDVAEKRASWWYHPNSGGGATYDYLGYGVTLATWFRSGELPLAVAAALHIPPGLEVDEQGVVIAAYRQGLSTFQTRWGTFTDPWKYQPQPHCGFVVVGNEGTISSWDYADHVKIQTRDDPAGHAIPVDVLADKDSSCLSYLLHVLEDGGTIEGPSSAEISCSGQRIVDTAMASAASGKVTPLVGAGSDTWAEN